MTFSAGDPGVRLCRVRGPSAAAGEAGDPGSIPWHSGPDRGVRTARGVLLPDEAQPLTAAQPEPGRARRPTPARTAAGTRRTTAPSAATASSTPRPRTAEKAARRGSPRPPPPEPRAERARRSRPPAPPPAPSGRSGSSNRVRARLARLGVQRSSPYNPVLEPLLRIVRGNDPKIETGHAAPDRAAPTRSPSAGTAARSARAATRTSPTRSPSPRSSPSWAWTRRR